MSRALLIGCGHSLERKVRRESQSPKFDDVELVRLDMNGAVKPDVIHDLNELPLPFPDGFFDEVHAYDVLEHVGRQGDWRGWFAEMAEYHRILRVGGMMGIIVPVGRDAFADPGHTRFFSGNHFGFLCKRFYDLNLAEGRPVTDYRAYITTWWEVNHLQEQGGDGAAHHLSVVLTKV